MCSCTTPISPWSEALRHAGYAVGTHVAIRWVDSETLTEENLAEKLGGV